MLFMSLDPPKEFRNDIFSHKLSYMIFSKDKFKYFSFKIECFSYIFKISSSKGDY